MRNVDCEWLVNESHDCCHKELTAEWRKRFSWWPRCVEYSMGYVDCKYRESLWDMLKKGKGGVEASKRPPPPPPGAVPNIPNWPRPPAPPRPPAKK